MGMKKKVLKAAGYAAAPKLTFLASNPQKAALVKAGAWAGEQVVNRMVPNRFRPQPKRTSFGMTAVKGLGAAAIAAPLGWWLGRMLMNQSEGQQQR